jgi:hypothetical protein
VSIEAISSSGLCGAVRDGGQSGQCAINTGNSALFRI